MYCRNTITARFAHFQISSVADLPVTQVIVYGCD